MFLCGSVFALFGEFVYVGLYFELSDLVDGFVSESRINVAVENGQVVVVSRFFDCRLFNDFQPFFCIIAE